MLNTQEIFPDIISLGAELEHIDGAHASYHPKTIVPKLELIAPSLEDEEAMATTEAYAGNDLVGFVIADVEKGDTSFAEVFLKVPRTPIAERVISRESKVGAWLVRQGIDTVPFIPNEDITLGGRKVPVIASRFASKGSLVGEVLEKDGVDQFLDSFSNALEPIVALHGVGRVVMDIRPANFVQYQDGSISFIDYGSVINAGNYSTGVKIGYGHGYFPPELGMVHDDGVAITSAADVFCLGQTVANIVAGKPVVVSQKANNRLSDPLSQDQILDAVYISPRIEQEIKALPHDAQETVLSAIYDSPNKRPNIHEFQQRIVG
jgi:Protein kinase domain